MKTCCLIFLRKIFSHNKIPVAVAPDPLCFVSILTISNRYDRVKLIANCTENITISRPSASSLTTSPHTLAPTLPSLPSLGQQVLVTHHLVVVDLLTERSLASVYHIGVVGGRAGGELVTALTGEVVTVRLVRVIDIIGPTENILV